MFQVDLTKLDDVQLATLAASLPDAKEAVREERLRRLLFKDVDVGLTALAASAIELEGRLDNIKKTAAGQAVKATAILDTINRLLLTAERDGYKFERPSLVMITEGSDGSQG